MEIEQHIRVEVDIDPYLEDHYDAAGETVQ